MPEWNPENNNESKINHKQKLHKNIKQDKKLMLKISGRADRRRGEVGLAHSGPPRLAGQPQDPQLGQVIVYDHGGGNVKGLLFCFFCDTAVEFGQRQM